MTMPVIDSESLGIVDGHVHLDQVPEVQEALSEARRRGLLGVVAVGMNEKSSRLNLEFSMKYPGFVIPAVGIHPWMVEPETAERETLAVLSLLNAASALGEVGLDYKISRTKDLQKHVFHRLLEGAGRLEKPVIIHSRYAHARAFEIVRDMGIQRAVFHWYSGPMDVLIRIIDSGYFISVTPALAYSASHREAARYAPLDQILIETDAPVSYQGVPAVPIHLYRTLELLAEIKSVAKESVAGQTTRNARSFFGIPWGQTI